MRTIAVIFLLVLSPCGATADEPSGVPFDLPVPEGWRTETIPFPLEFAPELDYEGLEELRFAPGMFEAGSEDFWSYAFVWWLALGTELDAETLASDLEAYFRGLARAVAESNGFDLGDATFAARLQGDGRTFHGEAETLDAFVTRKPVLLNVHVEIRRCEDEKRLAVFFELSPQPDSHAIWETLAQIRQGFRCRK